MSFNKSERPLAVAGAWPVSFYTHPLTERTLMRPTFVGGRFTSSATVGSRTLRLEVLNEAGLTVDAAPAGNSQAASLTNRYTWHHRVASFSSLTSGSVFPSYIPGAWLWPGWSLQIRDVAAVDAAADIIEIFMQYVCVPIDALNSGKDVAAALGVN